MRNITSLAFVGMGGLLFAAPGLAHHSFSAEFDANMPITLTGTVTKVEWQNPHTWFYIDVKDEAGNVTNWGMELASPNLLMRQGWTRNTIKNGDVVTVESFRAKNGSNIANAHSITLTETGQKVLSSSRVGGAQ
jgi:DNA/RNA endonuclease YhcR with UshA esterase domain